MMYEAELNRGLESLRSLDRAALNRFAGGKMSGGDYVAISRKIDKAIEILKEMMHTYTVMSSRYIFLLQRVHQFKTKSYKPVFVQNHHFASWLILLTSSFKPLFYSAADVDYYLEFIPSGVHI